MLSLGILYRFVQMVIVTGQGHDLVGVGEVGMEQIAEIPVCMSLVQTLLDLRRRLLPPSSSFSLGVHREYLRLHILTTYIFLSLYVLCIFFPLCWSLC